MLLERATKKRQLVDATRTRSKAYLRMRKAKAELRQRRKAELAEKIRTHGLSGRKIGKHLVPEEGMDVQLSEDVSDSLRAMKVRFNGYFQALLCSLTIPQVEGNLFRDRFVSLQHRAIIEPRVPVLCVSVNISLPSTNGFQRTETEIEGQGDRKACVQAVQIGLIYLFLALDAIDVPFTHNFISEAKVRT